MTENQCYQMNDTLEEMHISQYSIQLKCLGKTKQSVFPFTLCIPNSPLLVNAKRKDISDQTLSQSVSM